MTNDTPYNIVHIVTSGEYKTPLVAAQVFDRAQVQATKDGPGKPASVSVWIIAPMRELLQKEAREIVTKLKVRCPAIKIKMIGGIGRLNNWPIPGTLKKLRKSLQHRTVYHCRGESSYDWAYLVKRSFPADAVALDIRGFTPLERFVNEGLFNVKDLSADQRKIYDEDVVRLKRAIQNSDAVLTVSEPLRKYLISHLDAPAETLVVPCCVTSTISDTNRERLRQELNIGNKTAILYLGGTQKYQHLEDLVLPFIRSAISSSENNVGVFITQNKDKMLSLIRAFGIHGDKVAVISVEQSKVADYLTAMDIGLLLRAPNELNTFSQPVKFGEYLSAGLPVVVEEGTGDIASMLVRYETGYVVSLTGKQQRDFDNEVQNAVEWCRANNSAARKNARRFVNEYYTWDANVAIERKMYLDTLHKVSVKK